jgi:hypothetical protein
MPKKLIKILNFIPLFLIALCLSIFLEHVSFAQVPAERRIPQPEPFPSTSPPVKCIPEAQKASWLLPTPTNSVLWKNLRSNKVSVWVPYKYQLSNNFQAQQPVLPGTIVFQSDDRLKAIDPTGKSSQPEFTISRQQRFSSFSAAESYVQQTVDGMVKALSDPSLREKGAKISVNRQKVILAGRLTDHLVMELDVTEAARRQPNQASPTRAKLAWYFPIDPQTNTLWGVVLFASPEDFGSRASEFEKTVCTFIDTF